MIDAYGKNGKMEKVLNLFEQMKQNGMKPNEITWIVIISACAEVSALDLGRKYHKEIIKNGIKPNIILETSLINMYSKSGSLEEAETIFNNMKLKNVITYNAMIDTYGKNGKMEKVLNLFEQMKQNGVKPNEITWIAIISACAKVAALDLGRKFHKEIIKSGIKPNIILETSLINMYSKSGSLEEAETIFNNMKLKDIITYNAMIGGYCQHGYGKDAINLFKQMQKEKICPDENTLIVLLNACSHSGLVEEALYYFSSMEREFNIKPNIKHYNCIVDSLGRSGKLEEAEKFIETIEQPDIITWKALLGACRIYG